MKRRKGAAFIAKTAALFDVPGEPALGFPRVTITGTSRAHIENHRGLLEYGEEQITVNAAGMMIRLRGERMEIAAMTDLELVVTGTVLSVEFLV